MSDQKKTDKEKTLFFKRLDKSTALTASPHALISRAREKIHTHASKSHADTGRRTFFQDFYFAKILKRG